LCYRHLEKILGANDEAAPVHRFTWGAALSWTPVARAQQALPRRVTGDQLLTTSVNSFWQQIN